MLVPAGQAYAAGSVECADVQGPSPYFRSASWEEFYGTPGRDDELVVYNHTASNIFVQYWSDAPATRWNIIAPNDSKTFEVESNTKVLRVACKLEVTTALASPPPPGAGLPPDPVAASAPPDPVAGAAAPPDPVAVGGTPQNATPFAFRPSLNPDPGFDPDPVIYVPSAPVRRVVVAPVVQPPDPVAGALQLMHLVTQMQPRVPAQGATRRVVAVPPAVAPQQQAFAPAQPGSAGGPQAGLAGQTTAGQNTAGQNTTGLFPHPYADPSTIVLPADPVVPVAGVPGQQQGVAGFVDPATGLAAVDPDDLGGVLVDADPTRGAGTLAPDLGAQILLMIKQ